MSRVNKIKNHIIAKVASQVLLVALFFTVLFGYGVHLHISLHHLFGHDDSHITVHVHASADEEPLDSDEKNSHRHPVVTIELSGKFSHSVPVGISGPVDWNKGEYLVDDASPGYPSAGQFAIPPPAHIAARITVSSLTLRAPPEA
jgi:predicted dehydrogenase